MVNSGASGFSAADDRRVVALSSASALVFVGLLLRLFYLQIVIGPAMTRRAEQNRTQVIPLLAPRGLLLDRRGEVLVDNAPRFSLFYSHTPQSPSFIDVQEELARRFPKDHGAIFRKMAEARRFGKMTRILSNIQRQEALALMERRMLLPGVNVIVEPQRRARFGALASHALGYVEEIDAAELGRYRDRGLRQGQRIGKTGLERYYDERLRGLDGGLQFETDAAGRHVQVIRRIPSEPGQDLHLTLDRRLQEVAEAALDRSPSGRGAVVAVDPRDGAVRVLASRPGSDPSQNLFESMGDPGLPLFNRALQGTYPPGSVFKMVTAACALSDVGWDVRKAFYCTGAFRSGAKEFACWGVHRRKDFFGAVAWSCNVYFYNMGLAIGPDFLEAMARSFGLGEKTGIDMPTESSGLIPGRSWKRKAQREGWFDGDTVNMSIGQGAVTATPIQAAVLMASVANGGTLWRPFLVERVVDSQDRILVQGGAAARRRVALSDEVWGTLRRALEGVVTTGSGRAVNRPDLAVGAKTGTAQNPHGEDHSWFAVYAGRPGESPSLALAVFVENGGRGSVAGGPIAREILDAAFPRGPA